MTRDETLTAEEVEGKKNTEMKERYSKFIVDVSDILGLGKPIDILRLCATTDRFFTPLQKQIQIDAEQIRALQKQNGELTDELTLTNNECKDMREELKQRIRENQKLCEQIEKMKCCYNCDFVFRGEGCYYDKECKNKDHWKLRR